MYTRYQSNTERFRQFIGTHRCDIDYSAQYAAYEDVFISIGKGDKKSDATYQLDSVKKTLLDSFMEAREGAFMNGRGNINVEGKPAHFDQLGRPIISCDGVIPQIERYADKFSFSKLNITFFEKALQAMVSKSTSAQGNE